MKPPIYFSALLLGVLTVMSPYSAIAEEWSIKEFQVITENPYPTTWFDVQRAIIVAIGGTQAQASYAVALEKKYEQEQKDLESAPKISPDMVTEIEDWLPVVAKEYEDMGFKEPYYQDRDSATNKYKVYLYHFSTGAQAGMLSRCATGGKKTYMKIDSGRNFLDGKLTTKGSQDLAHELFHAVQDRYELFANNCNIGDWITEGTAEAVGIEMARRLDAIKPYGKCQIGVRSYSRRLYIETARSSGCGRDAYLTSSFWRYLGEYNRRKHKSNGYGKKPKVREPVFPSYEYLAEFFEVSVNNVNEGKEYNWLDARLREKYGFGLNRAYSNFSGAFAEYWRTERMEQYEDVVQDVEKWMKRIYGLCIPVTLSPKEEATIPNLIVQRVGSRCLKIHFSGFDEESRVNLLFYAKGEQIDLESLAISTNGGKKVIRRSPAEPSVDKLGKFSVTVKPDTYFIVTNVAERPGETQRINHDIVIVPDFVSSTTAKAKKKTQEKENPTNTEELENAWGSRSWHGHVRQSEKSSCTMPFDAGACGATTGIYLQLMPDAGQLLDEVMDPAMSMERRMNVGDAFAKRGGQLFADIATSLEEIQKLDGWSIGLTIPQIQPGFTGSVSNAAIKVAKAYKDGKPNGSYRAIGSWVGPCPPESGGYHPANGQVTIKEFSRNVLRGSFSANLVDNAELCGGVSVARTIQEDFVITNIRWGKTLPPPEVSDDDLIDRQVEDVNEVIPGLIPEGMKDFIKEKTRQEREKQRQDNLNQADQGGGVGSIQCDCQCHMEKTYCEANTQSLCCRSCEPVFSSMCRGEQKVHSGPLTPDEVQDMRQQYEVYLDAHGMGSMAEVKNQMMQEFDNIPTAEEKRMFLKVLPK